MKWTNESRIIIIDTFAERWLNRERIPGKEISDVINSHIRLRNRKITQVRSILQHYEKIMNANHVSISPENVSHKEKISRKRKLSNSPKLRKKRTEYLTLFMQIFQYLLSPEIYPPLRTVSMHTKDHLH